MRCCAGEEHVAMATPSSHINHNMAVLSSARHPLVPELSLYNRRYAAPSSHPLPPPLASFSV